MLKYLRWLVYRDLPKEDILRDGRYEEKYYYETADEDLITCYRISYYRDGKLHREGGKPSYFDTCYSLKEWYKYGRLHREDGPAIERRNSKEWYINGLRHRGDGPAYTGEGISIWYNNDLPHREVEPAVLTYDKCIISKVTNFANITGNIKIIAEEDGKNLMRNSIQEYSLCRDHDMYLVNLSNLKGELYIKNGVLHREDGPAITCSYGKKVIAEIWYKDGVLQRESGPLLD